VSFSTID